MSKNAKALLKQLAGQPRGLPVHYADAIPGALNYEKAIRELVKAGLAVEDWPYYYASEVGRSLSTKGAENG